ncbi:MAG: serine hydrolase, partial [Stackebrandtia sp.]
SNIDKRLATGYRPEGGEQVVTKGQFNPWSPTGPGQVTTAADMGRFMIDQLAEESELGTGIPAELMKQQYTQSEGMPGMGYIYEERPRNGMRVLFKGGDGSGFHNHMVLLPKAGMGIFFAVNGDGNDEFDSGALAEAVIDEYFPAGEVEKATPLKGHGVDGYAGDYQSSRVSHHSILKLRALTQDRVTVTANADGTVTTTGRTLSTHEDADSQKWIQVKPGLFRESNGPGTIAFDGEGVLTGSRSQNQVYLEQSWYDSPVLHQYLALAALAVLLLGLVALPTAALFARRRPQSRGPKAARLLAWLTCLLTLATTVALISLMSNQDAALEVLAVGSPLLVTVMAAASLVVAAAAGMCVAAVTAWWRGWWRLSGRVSYSLLSLSTVLFATLAITYNLTGPPFD